MILEDWNWTIGQVVAPFGRMGEVKVRYETDFPERFKSLKQVCLRPAVGPPILFEVEGVRSHKGQALVKLKGVDSINDANAWRGAKVQVPRESAVPLPQGAYYAADLIGAEVYTKQGQLLGKLDQILPYPAQDLYKVGEILIPAVKEIVLSVDAAAKKIIVDPPEGLISADEN
jgi:16S rRNA processing protein RimM